MVTPGFWDVFASPIALGRAFGDDEENHNERVVVLSDSLWRDRFGAAADVIGRNVDLSGESFRVVGVAKAGFRYPADAQIWIPTFIPASAYRDKRDSHFLRAVARIRNDASPAQAAAVMKTITDDEARRFPDTETGLASGIKPLQAIIAADLSQPLRMLLIAAALVLADRLRQSCQSRCSRAARCARRSSHCGARSVQATAGWCAKCSPRRC